MISRRYIMNRTAFKRILSAALVLVMVLGIFPAVNAVAEDEHNHDSTGFAPWTEMKSILLSVLP